jgi:hypothetical protein
LLSPYHAQAASSWECCYFLVSFHVIGEFLALNFRVSAKGFLGLGIERAFIAICAWFDVQPSPIRIDTGSMRKVLAAYQFLNIFYYPYFSGWGFGKIHIGL